MRRRWLKWAAWAVLALVLLGVLAVGGLWLFLQSERGGARLRAELVERVDARIAGSLEVGHLDLSGTLLVLREVVLRGPLGEPILQVEQVEVEVAPLELLRGVVVLERVALRQPELHLVLEEEGTNLQRALAPTEAPAPEEPEAPEEEEGFPSLNLRVDWLRLERGLFTVRPSPEAREPSLHLAGLEAEGEGVLLEPTRTVQLGLRADARLLAPDAGDFLLRLNVGGAEGAYGGRALLEAAGAHLDAYGRVQGATARVVLERLHLPPELVRAVAPEWPLEAPLGLEGELTREEADVWVRAEATAATAHAEVSGHLDVETWRSRGLEVRLRDVNLAELLAEGPRSDLSLEATAQGGGRSLEELTGELRVTVPPSPIADTTLGPILLEARAEAGRFVLEQGEFNLPGASLTARGQGTPEEVALSGTLVATNLRQLSRTLGQLLEPERLPVQGRGRATFELKGPTRNPTVSIAGRFPLLRWEEQTLRGLTVRLQVPDLADWLPEEDEEEPGVPPAPPTAVPPPAPLARQPGPIRLQVEVQEPGLEELMRQRGLDISLRGVTQADVTLSGSLEDPRLDARVVMREVVTEGMPPVDVTARAFTRAGGQLSLVLGARVEDRPSEVAVHLPFTLARLMEQPPSQEELLRAPLTVEGEFRELPLPLALADLRLEDVEVPPLARAPVLSGQVRLRGTLLRPEGQLALSVSGLGVEGEVPISLAADVALQPAQTRVEAWMRQEELLLLRTLVRFEGPLGRLLDEERRGEVALSGDVLLGPVPVERFALFLRLVEPRILQVAGPVRGDLRLAGRVGEPGLEGVLEWENGRLEVLGYGDYRDIHLLVRAEGEQVVLEELVARSAGGEARLSGTLLLQEERMPFQVRANLTDFPIVADDQLLAHVSLVASAEGAATQERVDVSPLRIDRARVEIPSTRARELMALEPPENVVFLRHGEPVDAEPEAEEEVAEREAPAGTGDVLQFRVDVVAPRALRVVGDDLDVEVGLGEDFRIIREQEEPEAFGRAFARRGRLSFLGKRFELAEQSEVRFTGPIRRPTLDVEATHVNRREGVTVTLQVQGQPPDLEILLSSTPPLSETEILTLLVTGRTDLRPGATGGAGGVGGGAVSVLGGFLARELEGRLDRTLPLDYLEIEPGAEGLQGTRVRAGTFIGERIYLGLETQLGAGVDTRLGRNRNEFNLEYLLTRRLLLELQYGDARVGLLELRWRRRY